MFLYDPPQECCCFVTVEPNKENEKPVLVSLWRGNSFRSIRKTAVKTYKEKYGEKCVVQFGRSFWRTL